MVFLFVNEGLNQDWAVYYSISTMLALLYATKKKSVERIVGGRKKKKPVIRALAPE